MFHWGRVGIFTSTFGKRDLEKPSTIFSVICLARWIFSAEAERYFKKLALIRSCRCSAKVQGPLNQRALFSIECDLGRETDSGKIIYDFAIRKAGGDGTQLMN